MAAAASSSLYGKVFKKKLADIVKVGVGGGLCFCGINVYFKNDKFYDDWVMPIFHRMEPETAHNMALTAAKYNLVPKSKLQESKLLVSKQPEKGVSPFVGDEEDTGVSCGSEDPASFPPAIAVVIDQPMPSSMGYSNPIEMYTQSCNSPCKSTSSMDTPDSPSLSMRVNIDSPLRSSKVSLESSYSTSRTYVGNSSPCLDFGEHYIMSESADNKTETVVCDEVLSDSSTGDNSSHYIVPKDGCECKGSECSAMNV